MVKLKAPEKIILQELKKAKRGYTTREICDVSEYTRQTVTKYLETLQEKDLVGEERKGGIYLYYTKENLSGDCGEEKYEWLAATIRGIR